MRPVHIRRYSRRRRPKEPMLARALYSGSETVIDIKGNERTVVIRDAGLAGSAGDVVREDEKRTLTSRTIREAAASTLDDLLEFDVVPPTYIREYKAGVGNYISSFQTHVKGVDLWNYKGNYLNTTDMIKIFILDFILGQTDRHGENILVDKKGHVWAIDNEATLGDHPMGGWVSSDNAAWKESQDMPIPKYVRRALKNLAFEDFITALAGVSRKEIDAAWRRKLEAERWEHIPTKSEIVPLWAGMVEGKRHG